MDDPPEPRAKGPGGVDTKGRLRRNPSRLCNLDPKGTPGERSEGRDPTAVKIEGRGKGKRRKG